MCGIFRQEVFSVFSVTALITRLTEFFIFPTEFIFFYFSVYIFVLNIYWIATEKTIKVHLRQYNQERKK